MSFDEYHKVINWLGQLHDRLTDDYNQRLKGASEYNPRDLLIAADGLMLAHEELRGVLGSLVKLAVPETTLTIKRFDFNDQDERIPVTCTLTFPDIKGLEFGLVMGQGAVGTVFAAMEGKDPVAAKVVTVIPPGMGVDACHRQLATDFLADLKTWEQLGKADIVVPYRRSYHFTARLTPTVGEKVGASEKVDVYVVTAERWSMSVDIYAMTKPTAYMRNRDEIERQGVVLIEKLKAMKLEPHDLHLGNIVVKLDAKDNVTIVRFIDIQTQPYRPSSPASSPRGAYREELRTAVIGEDEG